MPYLCIENSVHWFSQGSSVLWLHYLSVSSKSLVELGCGAMRSIPVVALQVGMNEMPLGIRSTQFALMYWAKGHEESHPAHLLR